MNFADRLFEAVNEKQSPLCVGIDPRLGRLPEEIKQRALKLYGNTLMGAAHAYREFCYGIIEVTHDIIPVAKPQAAFFEVLGALGFALLEDVVRESQDHGIVTIVDGKRNDIGSTAEAYSNAFLGRAELFDGQKVPVVDADALTVNAYFGTDGVKPFVNRCSEFGKGIFCLVKTSNNEDILMGPILKLDDHDEDKEIEFELNYLLSLTTQQRFEMMLQKTQEMRNLLKRHEHGKTTQIIKRT